MKRFRQVVGNEVRFSIDPNSKCPCGSKASAASCCLASGSLRKNPASTRPPPPATGVSLPGCYAAPLADCNSTLSREHFVSRSLLDRINRDDPLRVSGFPWQQSQGQEKELPPVALASRILCVRHNNILSPLDAFAAPFLDALNEQGAAGSGRRELRIFSGHDLERWLLKILCGAIHSRNLQIADSSTVPIPEAWLRILFGYEEFSNDRGLYVCRDLNHRFEGPFGLKLQAISNSRGVSGLGAWVCGYEFIMSLSGFPNRTFDGRTFAYRPLELYTVGPAFENSVAFSWQGKSDGGSITCKINGIQIPISGGVVS